MVASDRLVVVRTCESRPEADVLRSLLEAYGIPVYIRGGDMPGVGGITEVGSGFRIMVPVDAEQDARSIVESAQRAASDGDADPL